jgi:hypothetical protein
MKVMAIGVLSSTTVPVSLFEATINEAFITRVAIDNEAGKRTPSSGFIVFSVEETEIQELRTYDSDTPGGRQP